MINNNLTKEIINHIFSALGANKKKGFIKSDNFLQDKTIDFESFSGKFWSCEINLNNVNIQLALAQCSEDDEEYAFLSKIEGCPTYGCYLSYAHESSDSLICLSNSDSNSWIICNFYLQASFLAGMEQLSDISREWVPSENIDLIFQQMKEFISFHDNLNYE